MECNSGKTIYKSFGEAQKAIQVIQKFKRNGGKLTKRRNQKDSKPMKPYKCLECGFYHLTSQKTVGF